MGRGSTQQLHMIPAGNIPRLRLPAAWLIIGETTGFEKFCLIYGELDVKAQSETH
ncbi:uncharacterized protein FFB20_08455 [Fusarium fujikuroi]|nr:uncharacterized protein FFE2_03163 [Fusarium fujikuroi]SCN87700.1 uncharacterized protein FFM5_04104 [Fusarium fujikuroi]SCN89145.1 uncharacterized protein FFB20_08455 [Fusarium fujikuroi]SCO05595.1 uncharacterized protein FFC1_10038 [Fusarium fujikuroi]SCO36573.1 uncharacterized protein FFNC_05313 [Fusarium fujikuroi]